MPALNDHGTQDIKPYSQEHILNQSFDRSTQNLIVELLGSDGVTLQRMNADNMAVKITESGTSTYIGMSAPGTAESSALWQAYKVDTSSGTKITWADGNANFDNIASDLTALTYI